VLPPPDLRNDKKNCSFVFLLKHKKTSMWEKATVIWVLLFIPFPLCLQFTLLSWIERGEGQYNSSENVFLHCIETYLKLFKVHWKIYWEKNAWQNITFDFKTTSNNIWSDPVKKQGTVKSMWVYDTVWFKIIFGSDCSLSSLKKHSLLTVTVKHRYLVKLGKLAWLWLLPNQTALTEMLGNCVK